MCWATAAAIPVVTNLVFSSFAYRSGIINVGQQLSSGAALDHGSTGGDAYPRLAFPASSSFRRTTDGVSTNPSQVRISAE